MLRFLRGCVQIGFIFLIVHGFSLAYAQVAVIPEVRIIAQDLPSSVVSVVRSSVEAVVAQAVDQDAGEQKRVKRLAHTAAIQALATEGYFLPTVYVDVNEPSGQPVPVWRIEIDPGERVSIQAVTIQFQGGITTEQFTERRTRLERDWGLSVGKVFRNAEWEQSKTQLLTDLLNSDFPSARWVRTEAIVDAEENRAELEIMVDSGPQVILTEKDLRGFSRVDPDLVERYIRYDISKGFPYRRAALQEWQDQLQSSAFFRGVRVFVDLSSLDKIREAAEDAQAEPPNVVELPLIVQVSEARPRRANFILGIDSDVGPRLEAVYRQNIVFDEAVELETGAHLDKDRRLGFMDFHFAPTSNGTRYSTGVLLQNNDLNGVHTRQFAWGGLQTQISKDPTESSQVEFERRLGVRLAYENTDIDGAKSFSTTTLTGNWEWIRRDVDTPQDPRSGKLWAIGLGAGKELNGDNVFGRAHLRAQYWLPVSPFDSFITRTEVGYLWAKEPYRVPTDFLFRTGGSRTIRGYRFLRIGREFGDAIIGDRALAVASVEYNHFFNDTIGMALFVDTGGVANRFSEMDWKTGIGTGVRVRSPAGPIQVDFAYGLDDKKIRLHFALGLAL